jgi:hypothetical protein
VGDTYHELIVKGPFDRVKAFFVGYLAGKGVAASRVYFSRECGIRQEKLPEKIVEWVGIVKDRAHVLIPTEQLAPIRSALRKHGAALGLDYLTDRKVSGAVLGFRFECFSREIAVELKRRFRRLPAGLEMLPGHSLREEENPGAEGPEMYSPVHDYELRGHGKIAGPVDKIIRFREKLEQNDLIRLRLIELQRG